MAIFTIPTEETHTTLSQGALNKRASEVFELRESDYIYDVYVLKFEDGSVEVNVEMEEAQSDGELLLFDYKPDMSGRPEALDYLLGKRDNFND